MKNIITLSIIMLAALSTYVNAQDAKKFSVQPKFGLLQLSIDDINEGNVTASIEDGSAKGISFGVNMDENWSMELTLLNGDFDIKARGYSSWSTNVFTETLKGDVKTQALYGAFRSSGDFYFMCKAGFLKEKVTIADVSESESGLSYGLGAGYRVNDNVAIELDYTIIEADVSFLGLNANFSF